MNIQDMSDEELNEFADGLREQREQAQMSLREVARELDRRVNLTKVEAMTPEQRQALLQAIQTVGVQSEEEVNGFNG